MVVSKSLADGTALCCRCKICLLALLIWKRQACVLEMKWKSARVESKFKSKIPTAIRLSSSSLLAIEESQSKAHLIDVTFRDPIPSHPYETNLRSYSRRLGCSRLVRGACACRAGGRARFRADRHDGLRPDPTPTLGHYGLCAGAGWGGHRRVGSGPPRQSFRRRLRAT